MADPLRPDVRAMSAPRLRAGACAILNVRAAEGAKSRAILNIRAGSRGYLEHKAGGPIMALGIGHPARGQGVRNWMPTF